MSQSLDRRLNLIETAKLKLHLLVCAWCSRYLTQIGMIRSIIRDVSDHENENPTAGLSSEARGRIGKCFAQKVLSTARWSAISTVPRAKRSDVALQLFNDWTANYENHIGKSSATSGRFARGTVLTIASFFVQGRLEQ